MEWNEYYELLHRLDERVVKGNPDHRRLMTIANAHKLTPVEKQSENFQDICNCFHRKEMLGPQNLKILIEIFPRFENHDAYMDIKNTEKRISGIRKRQREPDGEIEASNSHLLKIGTRFKFVEEYTQKDSSDFSHLKSLISEEINRVLTDSEKTEISIVKVEEVNKNVSIYLDVPPHMSINNISARMKEMYSQDHWFVYDQNTKVTGDGSGGKWELKIKTIHSFKEEGEILPQIRAMYERKMADLLRQLDKNLTVEVDIENITNKDGYDFVPFKVQSGCDIETRLRKHLIDRCRNWNFTESDLIKREEICASWIPTNDKKSITDEVTVLLQDNLKQGNIYKLKVQRLPNCN